MSESNQLYFGGQIYTVDDNQPLVEAVAVADGRIVATGSLEKCRAALGPSDESIDLEGCAMLPGFIDTHTFASCTAYMNQPFSDQPDTKGYMMHNVAEMYQRMVMAHTADLQIAIHTVNAAYAQFEDSVKGNLSVGKRADLVILSDHPGAVPTDQIKNIRVERTICAGKSIYKAQA